MANPITAINNAITGLRDHPPAEEKAKVYRYRCKCDCTFGGDYHKEGDIITSEEKLEVPHFQILES